MQSAVARAIPKRLPPSVNQSFSLKILADKSREMCEPSKAKNPGSRESAELKAAEIQARARAIEMGAREKAKLTGQSAKHRTKQTPKGKLGESEKLEEETERANE